MGWALFQFHIGQTTQKTPINVYRLKIGAFAREYTKHGVVSVVVYVYELSVELMEGFFLHVGLVLTRRLLYPLYDTIVKCNSNNNNNNNWVVGYSSLLINSCKCKIWKGISCCGVYVCNV